LPPDRGGRRRRSSPAAPRFDAHPRLAVTRRRPLCPWPPGPHRPVVAQAHQLPPRVPPPLSVVETTWGVTAIATPIHDRRSGRVQLP
jgi:hypothetical protein